MREFTPDNMLGSGRNPKRRELNDSDIGADNAEEMTPRVYYGWWIVAGLFFILTISSGFGFYNLSVYMNLLAELKRRSGFAASSSLSSATLKFSMFCLSWLTLENIFFIGTSPLLLCWTGSLS